MLDTDVLGNVQKLAPVMEEQLGLLVDKHVCVRQARCAGLFGCLDLEDPKTGRLVQRLEDPNPPAVVALKKALRANGIYAFLRPPLLHCAPPLIISEEELVDGFDRVSRSLSVMDDTLLS